VPSVPMGRQGHEMSSRTTGALARLLLLTSCGLGSGVASAAEPASALEAPAIPSAEPGTKIVTFDRQTPRSTIEGFLRNAKDGDFRRAADYLDLRTIPEEARERDGSALASKLAYFLQRQPSFDPAKLIDDPEGEPGARGTYVARSRCPSSSSASTFPTGSTAG
jgi:hypothetical protein